MPSTMIHIDQRRFQGRLVHVEQWAGHSQSGHAAPRGVCGRGTAGGVRRHLLARDHRAVHRRVDRSARPVEDHCLRLRAQRRSQPDGRGPAQAALGRPGPRSFRGVDSDRVGQSPCSRRDEGARCRPQRGVPEAAHRRVRPCGGRRDHDGLWRRLSDLSRQEVRGLGPRRSCRAGPADGAPHPRRDRHPGASAPRRATARVSFELPRRLAAEIVGTFALVFAGCGAVMVDAKTGALGHVGVAITFGLVIMAMIYAVGHISGAHFNPAVTFAFALSRHFPWPRAFGYWGAQLVGALVAAAILRGSLGPIAHVGATLPSGSQGPSFLWEVVLTFFLMFVIMAVATDTRAVGEAAAIAIGGTVLLDAMFGGPISGASMNPARSIGPAFVSGDLHALWLYIAAPILGATLAALTYQFVRGEWPAS